jgi:hypothetical protein
MTNGGKRRGAGRKKIGILINTRIEKELLNMIENNIGGISRAEKIRNCLREGIKSYEIGEKTKE